MAKTGLDKKRLMRELERDRRSKVRSRVAELRQLIKVARAEKRAAIRGVQLQCAQARKKLRSVCQLRADRARAQGDNVIAARRGELGEQREIDRTIRDVDARGKRGPGVKRATLRERRAESDDEVRANIPRAMVGVFDSVRRYVKPTARMSRTEAFLQWAEENAGEVYAIQAQQAERDLARLLAEQERVERLSRKRGRLADVPF